MVFEAGIVDGEVTGATAVHSIFAELRDDDLFDLRTAAGQFGALGVIAGLGAGLVEISGLVPLPLVEELVVKDDSVNDQDDCACDCESQFHSILRRDSPWPSWGHGRTCR